jgi:UDP-N-acetylmuramate dehydrogenase
MISLDDIRQSFRGRIELNEEMARHVTFRIGGPADVYLEPLDKGDAVPLFSHLHSAGVPFRLIGNGSNVLIADEGIRGLVVSLAAGFNYVRRIDDRIIAGAGIRLATFVNFVITEGFGGAEMLAGIPGTLGGAIIMNAGAYGGEISDNIERIELIRSGALVKVQKEDAGFEYRTSELSQDIVLEASFRFPEGTTEPLKMKRKELLLKRNASQPVNQPNAGSIFKNPPGDYAARLIEECGLKERRVGGAEISQLHANFIVNVGGASAMDVIELMQITRSEVRKRFDVDLEPEIKPIGFAPDILRSLGIGTDVGQRDDA